MTDIIRLIEGVNLKFVDNGDGTYSVSTVGGGGTDLLNKEATQLLIKNALITDGAKVQAMTRVCTGTQLITALSASTAASLTIPANSVVAVIQADGGVVRLRQDATAPTTTRGMRLDDGLMFTVDSMLADVRLLAQSGTTTNVQVTYFDRV
jgi:hypothetical protein